MTDAEVHGPIDFVLIEFPGPTLGDELADALLALVDSGVVRLYDLLVVQKEADGTFSGLEISDLTADTVGGLVAFAGARSGLLGDEDVAQAADALAPGTIALLLLWENSWAIPFVRAATQAGGQVVASARIGAQEIMDALDAADAAD
jgi:hypothetical protein